MISPEVKLQAGGVLLADYPAGVSSEHGSKDGRAPLMGSKADPYSGNKLIP